jgi:hypothetical protein
MNGTPGGTITVGTRLCFDGGLWEVTELTATVVVLRDALGGLRQASISGLLAEPATRLLDTAPAEPAPAGAGTSGPGRCPAASASSSPSPWRPPSGPGCCCWTSRSRAWTRWPGGSSCGT